MFMMRNVTNVLTAVVVLSATVPVACDYAGDKSGNEIQVDSIAGTVTNLSLNVDIKSALANFRISDSEGSYDCYLTLSSRVQWPQRIGDFNIRPLQDSILNMMYPDANDGGIDAAMVAFVNNVTPYQLGDVVEKVDSVPSMSPYNNIYYCDVDLILSEVSDELVTYNISYEQYMGGAHPMGGSHPFTYDLETGRIITLHWLFKAGSTGRLSGVIEDAVASQLGMSAEELRRSMLVDTMPVSDNVYIENGQIVFHYNPYEVMPYSYGSIDIAVPYYLVEDMLTPHALKLLAD